MIKDLKQYMLKWWYIMAIIFVIVYCVLNYAQKNIFGWDVMILSNYRFVNAIIALMLGFFVILVMFAWRKNIKTGEKL